MHKCKSCEYYGMYVSYTEFTSKEQEQLFPCFPWYVLFNNFEGEREKRRFQKDGVIVKEERSTIVYCWVKAPGRRGGQESAANCTGWENDCRRERRVETRRRTERNRQTQKNQETNINHWRQLKTCITDVCVVLWQIINMITNTLN